jgi:hypothetical protein
MLFRKFSKSFAYEKTCKGLSRMTFSDCISCVERAWNGMIDVLFKPFDIVPLDGLGFQAWLACLMEGAGCRPSTG